MNPAAWLPFRAHLRRMRDSCGGWWFARCQVDPGTDQPRVFYGPALSVGVGGAPVKLQRLSAVFPPSLPYNLVYTVNVTVPPELCYWSARRGARVVLNADGVLYPASAPAEQIRRVNRGIRKVLDCSAWVLFQSEFARGAYETFIGKPECPSELLYNAIDTTVFRPADTPRNTGRFPVLLTAGHHRRFYRLEVPALAVALLKTQYPEILLRIAGSIAADNEPPIEPRLRELIEKYGLQDHIEFVPRYPQDQAPAIYQSADLFVHAQWQDNCPNTVLEAMACGLPVVYSATGGTPELVGEAGAGVPSQSSWERVDPPAPEGVAEGIRKVLAQRDDFAAKARARAVERFDIQPWLQRHKEIFQQLLQRDG